MDELPPTLECELSDEALVSIARAALKGGVVDLALVSPPTEQVWHVLELRAPSRSTVVYAEPLGLAKGGRFPLRVKPIDPMQRPELEEIAGKPGSVMPPSARGLLGGLLAGGKFSLDRVLGEGGMGAVYEATHRDLKKRVAIKVLHRQFHEDPKFAEQFQAEALTASRFDHPNAVRVLDFGREPEGLLYIVMEFLEGQSLEAILAAEGQQPLSRILPLLLQTCSALAAAHDRGIIHRDIKPGNIVLMRAFDDEGRESETAKVCDFGIATVQDGPAEEGQVAGSPAYMPPEQGQGLPSDARSDVYSLGATMYELVTGRPPFDAPDSMLLIVKHMTTPVLPPRELVPELSEAMERVILRCLEKEPSARYQSMRELRADLRAIADAPSASPLEGGGANATPLDVFGNATEEFQLWAKAEEESEQLTRDPNAVLARLDAMPDAPFIAELSWLKLGLKSLLANGHLASLSTVVERLEKHEKASPTAKKLLAIKQCLSAVDDEVGLAKVAEAALTGEPATQAPARRLLARKPTEGAVALLSARKNLQDVPPVAFIECVRLFAAAIAAPLFAEIRRLTHESPVDLAASFIGALGAIPNVSKQEGAELVGRHVASLLPSPSPPLELACAAALTNLLGSEARPYLIALLDRKDENVRSGAVASLRRIGSIDLEVVGHISRMLADPVGTSPYVKLMLVSALGEASLPARSAVMVALSKIVRPARTSLFDAFRSPVDSEAQTELVLTAAQFLLQKGGSQGRTVVEERQRGSRDPLKSKLEALLKSG